MTLLPTTLKKLLIAFSLLFFAWIVVATSIGGNEGAAPQCVMHFVRWLPANTESLLVAQAGVVLPADLVEEDKEPSMGDLLVMPAIMPLLLLADADCLEIVEGARVKHWVTGTRNFRAPRGGEGLVSYDGCHVLQFGDDGASRIKRLLAHLKRLSKEVKPIEAHMVYVVAKETDTNSWTFYFSDLEQGRLIIGTEESFVTEVLKGFNGAGGPRALPDELPEWKLVDRQATFWGIRHYDRKLAATDPSSPLLKTNGAKVYYDPEGVGVTFSYDLRVENAKLRVRLLSHNKDLDAVVRKRFDGFGFGDNLEVRRNSGGDVELLFDVSDPRTVSRLDTILLALFGWGVFI